MKHQLHQFALLVKDYDEAIQFYTEILGFKLLEDTKMSETKRWVRIAPNGSTETGILLAKAKQGEQQNFIGHQAGGRGFLFLHTDDCMRDYHAWKAKGVHFTETPRDEAYGIVVVFEDLYGNKWDLIERK